MPIKQAAIKAMRKDKKRHLRNIGIKSQLHTLIKKFNSLIDAKDIEKAKAFFRELVGKLDKAAARGIIHKSIASRRISRLSKKLSKLLSRP